MKSTTKKLAKISLFVCAALCAALILAQFMPYWTYDNSKTASSDTVSILEYLALPDTQKDVTSYLDSGSAEAINSLAGTFCIAFLLGAVSIVLVCTNPNSLWISVFPLVVGIGGLIGYLAEPRWQSGSIYIVLVILCGLLTVISIIPTVIWGISIRNWFLDPKDLKK